MRKAKEYGFGWISGFINDITVVVAQVYAKENIQDIVKEDNKKM